VRVASIGRDGNPTVPCLQSTLDAGGLPIQAIEVSASRFLQHAVEQIMQKNDYASIIGYRWSFFASIHSIGIIAVDSDQL